MAESCLVQSVPVAAAAALPPGLPPDRVEAAYKIGQFLRRCLSGGPRVLQEEHPFHCRALSTLFARATTSRSTTLLVSWAEAKAVVLKNGSPGPSIFVGVPTVGEARIAVEAAGCELPPALQ